MYGGIEDPSGGAANGVINGIRCRRESDYHESKCCPSRHLKQNEESHSWRGIIDIPAVLSWNLMGQSNQGRWDEGDGRVDEGDCGDNGVPLDRDVIYQQPSWRATQSHAPKKALEIGQ